MKRKKLSLPNKNIALVYRLRTSQAVTLGIELASWLSEKGYKVFTAPEQKALANTTAMKEKSQLAKMGLIIVLGGDGTYLRAVRMLGEKQIPILGFNMGNLGFLTAHHADEAFKVVEDTLKGKMTTCARSMIATKIIRKNKVIGPFYALNDVVIERGSNSQLINTAISVENKLVKEVRADGLIISSPSGSTAYNLAAGGPVLHPEVKAFVLTPVAPHSLTSRPLIFPDDREIEFKIAGEKLKAHLIVDGQKAAELSSEDSLIVSRCHFDHWVVRSNDHNFFHLLREKLRFGDR